MRLLLVEDDAMIGAGVQTGLRQQAFSVDWVRDARSAEGALGVHTYDALLLDLGLPDASGAEVLRKLRQRGSDIPILIITARDAVSDRVAGLNSGAESGLFQNTGTDSNPNFFGGAPFISVFDTTHTYEFAVSYDATATAFTGGSNVALLAIPEPNTAASLLAGLGSLLGLQRIRRRR